MIVYRTVYNTYKKDDENKYIDGIFIAETYVLQGFQNVDHPSFFGAYTSTFWFQFVRLWHASSLGLLSVFGGVLFSLLFALFNQF
jgi:hypothetical protein